MVQRNFAAFDNEAFVVDPSSPSLGTGSAIINNSSTRIGTIFTFTSGFEYQSIVVDDTSADPDTFNDDQPGNHTIVEGRGLVANGASVESESFHFVRALDANGIPTGDVITITVFSQGGNFSNIWGMAADAELQEGVRYQKIGGSNNGDSEYDSFVPCFTRGAQVSTVKGLIRIEDLRVGDRVMTRDNGLQDVRWIGHKALPASALDRDTRLRPIRIREGALGGGVPMADMVVSPNHRMLITGANLAMHFGEEEMLIAAKHLVGLPGIDVLPAQDTTYVHVLCDRHQVLMVDGAWTESFQPGEYTMGAIGRDQADEVFALFPELRDPALNLQFNDARTALRGFEADIARATLVH